MVPDLDLARINKWIAGRNDALPMEARHELRYEVDVTDRAITVLECRPPWDDDLEAEWTRHPICRFRYTKARKEWSLYRADAHSKFRRYDLAEPTPHIDGLIQEVIDDRTGIFWG